MVLPEHFCRIQLCGTGRLGCWNQTSSWSHGRIFEIRYGRGWSHLYIRSPMIYIFGHMLNCMTKASPNTMLSLERKRIPESSILHRPHCCFYAHWSGSVSQWHWETFTGRRSGWKHWALQAQCCIVCNLHCVFRGNIIYIRAGFHMPIDAHIFYSAKWYTFAGLFGADSLWWHCLFLFAWTRIYESYQWKPFARCW